MNAAVIDHETPFVVIGFLSARGPLCLINGEGRRGSSNQGPTSGPLRRLASTFAENEVNHPLIGLFKKGQHGVLTNANQESLSTTKGTPFVTPG